MGPPKKGINKKYKVVFMICFEKKTGSMKQVFGFPSGPGGFMELREAGRNHLHLSWYLIVPGVTSYEQKPWVGFFYRPQ